MFLNKFPFRPLVLIGLLVFLTRCDKTVDLPGLEPYAETSLDANGGTWKTFNLANGQELAVPAPTDVASAEYLAELQEVKNLSGQATTEQQQAARFWGAGAVLRWHEIARELAAQYNVPPNYNADGTYSAPDPMNPGAYPRFPFANPPYASRALALLSVAQYDGLVAAWHHKYQYNRRAPYHQDASLESLLPVTELPSYPSEDAVIAAASREVLKFLFPNEKALIDEKAGEHMDSRLWAGANVRSDLEAGEALGQEVAARIIAYAKTDGMSGANKQADLHLLVEDAEARGITNQWKSLDIPYRAPMLPFYGRVKTWNLTSAEMLAIRPEAPPQPGTPDFQKALDELREIAENRTREQYRITAFWADGVGTYTPPGHWDRVAAGLIYDNRMNELRAARTMALLNTAVQDAGISCWDTKFYYMLPRPTQVDPSITTATGIPNFPAYTSGHSSFSAAAATVLSYLFPDQAAEMRALAQEAADSRVYGGIHYRFDSEIGLRCGDLVGAFAVTRGQNDGSE
jgi:hypothetical protein